MPAEAQKSKRVKATIRRRVFLRHKQSGTTPPATIAEWFADCPECGGRGRLSEYETDEAGVPVAHYLFQCPSCEGAGFVDAIPFQSEGEKSRLPNKLSGCNKVPIGRA